jgi:hypothetical protein
VDGSSVFFGLLFGAIGSGFFLYGKKQQSMVPLACGITLMVLPYLIDSTAWLIVVGVAVMAVPYFVRP